MRSKLHGLLLLLFLAAAPAAGGAEYVRGNSREESLRRSLEATEARLAAYQLSPWHRLGAVEAQFGPQGATDLQRRYPAPGGETGWEPANLPGKGWCETDAATRYLYRTIVAPASQEVVLRLAARKPMVLRFNGAPLPGVGPPGWMADQLANVNEIIDFPVRLAAGTNHFSIRVHEPTRFYFELTPVTESVRAELDRLLESDFPPVGEAKYYRIETVPVPGFIALEVGGLGFMPDGRLMACTRRGEIWSLKEGQWTRFAAGLQEPMGLWPGPSGELYVMQRSELTRIRDTDGDGRGDHYETVNADCGVSTTQHAYIFGPVPDREGNWWGAISALGAAGQGKYFGWSFKITPDGAFHPWSSGLRSPNGILVTPEGEVFITDNQGEFMGTSPLHHVSRGAFHGHPHGLRYENGFQGDPFRLPIEELEKRRKPPAILFPYGSMGQSISQPLTDTTGGKFGPFQGQVFIGDVTKCNLMRVTLEKVEGEFQGACYPFRSGFQSGNNRLAFGPDGSLYVGQTDRGWGSVGGKSHGLQRVVWTGRTPFEIQEVRATSSGFELQFTRPVDRQTASQPAHYAIQHYYYRYHSAYGSPQVGNTPVAVASATVSPDGLRVQLTLPELVPLRIYEVACPGVKSRDQEAVLHPVAYYTLNRVPGRPGRLAAP